MGRPRKWASDAERKRAERATLPDEAGRTGSVTSVKETPDAETRTGLSDPPDTTASIPSLEAYVAENVLATKLLISQGRLKDHDGKRVERAKEYARQRYAGFLAGEVASL